MILKFRILKFQDLEVQNLEVQNLEIHDLEISFLGIDVPRKKKKEFINSEEKRPRGRPRKKRRPSEADYLMHRPMKRERLRADPLVSISSIFEKILTDLRTALVNDIDIFMKPVDKKTVADYYDVIQNPISIQDWKKLTSCFKYPGSNIYEVNPEIHLNKFYFRWFKL